MMLQDCRASERTTVAAEPERAPTLSATPAACPRLTRRALLAFPAAALAGLAWKFELKDRFVAKRWGVVEGGRIYRSGQISRYLIQPMLQKHGIRTVIDLTAVDSRAVDQPAEQQAIQKLGIRGLRYPLWGDGTGDIGNYAAAIQALVEADRAQQPVLVHCSAGTQRTGGVIACFRVIVQARPARQAVQELMRYGWHPVRDRILLVYLDQHWDELVRRLQEAHVIAAVPRERLSPTSY